MIRSAAPLACVLLWAVLCAAAARAADEPQPPADEQPVMPFVHIDREAGHIDVDAVVCLREGMLELAATTVGGKEHEAVFAIKALPQHIHLALLLLGLEPGRPGNWRYVDDQPMPIDPTGDRIAVSVIYEADGQRIEKPIHHFIHDSASGEPMPGNVFVFAGSRIVERQGAGGREYLANGTGDVISLVTFPEEDSVLAWPTASSHENAQLVWSADTQHVPELDTPVVLRLRPAGKAPPAKTSGGGRAAPQR